MTDLVNPEKPELLDPQIHRRLSGDWTDDDGPAIDEQFEPPFHGPVESEGLAYERDAIPYPTRIIARTVQIGTVDGVLRDPVQMFPVDLNRTKMIIQAGATNTLIVGSDKTDVYNNAAIASPTQWNVDTHTGALWVYSIDTHAVDVTVWVVTK